jgi:hypothetical protein
MRTTTRIAMSFLAATIVAVGGAPTAAPAWPIAAVTARCESAWPAPANVVERVAAAMLPTYGVEPTAYRAEARLSIAVAGVRRVIPAGIGIDPEGGVISAVSTRACDGVIHVAAPDEIDVYLGQLFTEWGVRLTQHCIGETCDADGVQIELDGERVDMCPGAISIEDGVSIELSV